MKTINHEKHVAIDYTNNVRISEVVVKCPNKNCEFTDELSLIENHMRTCDKNPRSCPYFEIGCKNDAIMIDEMKHHLCTELINNLRNEMESMKKEIVELKSEKKHLKEELEIIKFDSKNNQMKNEEFEKKIKNNLSEIEELNEEMVVLKNENKSIMNKLENIEKSRLIERMQRKSEQQTREIDEMKEKCEQTENKEIEMRRIIDEIFDKIDSNLMKKSNINNYDEKINNLQMQITEMERTLQIMNFGEFEWKIENFSQIPDETFIYSEPFYSHNNGYKMCLSVRIGLVFSDCVDVNFHLMRGEFDDDLLWSFNHGITIDVINQMDGSVSTSGTIRYDDCPNNCRWDKPTTTRNIDLWFHEIDISDEIIRNDQMLIKCKIKI